MPLRQCDNKQGLPYGDDSSFARGVEGQLEKDAAVTGVQEFSNPAGDEAVAVEAVLEAGKRYELRVHSYYAAQQFDVRADLTPH